MQAHRYLEGNILCLHDVSWWLRPTLSLKSSDIPDKSANLTPLNELLNSQTWSCIAELISHCVVSTAFLKRKCSGFGWGFVMAQNVRPFRTTKAAFSCLFWLFRIQPNSQTKTCAITNLQKTMPVCQIDHSQLNVKLPLCWGTLWGSFSQLLLLSLANFLHEWK